jgi:mannose-6-phosphate isomerase-like protein (cupin superfamily)
MSKSLSIVVATVLLMFSIASMAQTQNSSPSSAASSPSGSDGVKYFSKDEVLASFAKGATLATDSNYNILTAHRTPSTDAKVEVHRSYTDVFYIVQGGATIITGGKMLGENDENPDEPRGTAIEGGETRHLSAGDALSIAPGVPHLMKDVQGDLLYFVVKVKKAKP